MSVVQSKHDILHHRHSTSCFGRNVWRIFKGNRLMGVWWQPQEYRKEIDSWGSGGGHRTTGDFHPWLQCYQKPIQGRVWNIIHTLKKNSDVYKIRDISPTASRRWKSSKIRIRCRKILGVSCQELCVSGVCCVCVIFFKNYYF